MRKPDVMGMTDGQVQVLKDAAYHIADSAAALSLLADQLETLGNHRALSEVRRLVHTLEDQLTGPEGVLNYWLKVL